MAENETKVERLPMIQCENLVKIYKTKDLEVLALQGLELRIDKGELLAIVGNSGSGKSTFLNLLGGLDRPSAGRLIVDGKDLFKLTDQQLVDYKRRTVGFVWQNNARNLVPYLTALENILLPISAAGSDRARMENRLALLIDEDIARLHIEVVHLTGMDIAQGIGNLARVAQGISLREATLALHQVGQGAVFKIFHHIVGRTVLLKHIIDADDVGMLQASDVLRLLDKFITKLCHHFLATLGTDRYVRGIGIAVAILAHEELLDGHAAVQAHLHSRVGDPKAPMPQLTLDAVLAMLQ